MSQFLSTCMQSDRSGIHLILLCLYFQWEITHRICCSKYTCDIPTITMTYYVIYGAEHIQLTHYSFFLWWLWEYVYFILLSSSNRKYDPLLLFRVRSWNNGMRCMYFYILMQSLMDAWIYHVKQDIMLVSLLSNGSHGSSDTILGVDYLLLPCTRKVVVYSITHELPWITILSVVSEAICQWLSSS